MTWQKFETRSQRKLKRSPHRNQFRRIQFHRIQTIWDYPIQVFIPRLRLLKSARLNSVCAALMQIRLEFHIVQHLVQQPLYFKAHVGIERFL